MKDNDASFTSLQDNNEKLCGFLDWLLDAIEVHNGNPRRKPIIAPPHQSEHAVQALSCVTKCQMGVTGQADWLESRKRHVEGAIHKGQHLQADLGACTGSLDRSI